MDAGKEFEKNQFNKFGNVVNKSKFGEVSKNTNDKYRTDVPRGINRVDRRVTFADYIPSNISSLHAKERADVNADILYGNRDASGKLVMEKAVITPQTDSLNIIKSKEVELGECALMYVNPHSQDAVDSVARILQLIKESGIVYRTVIDNRAEHRSLGSKDLLVEALSSQGYYHDLVSLGRGKFGSSLPDETYSNISFIAKYPIVGEDIRGKSVCTSGTISSSVNIKMYGKFDSVRRHVMLTDAEIKQDAYTQEFASISQLSAPGKDKLARGLGIDKLDSKDIAPDAILPIISKVSGSNRITRFTKLWGLLLWLDKLEPGQECDIEVPSFYSVSIHDHSGAGLTDACRYLHEGNATCIYTHETDPTMQAILCLAVTRFPVAALMVRGKELWFGGFSIPSEIDDKGRIVMIGPGIKGKRSEAMSIKKIVVTKQKVYSAICSYARHTGAYDDMQTGQVLAVSLLVSDMLPQFCLPKSPGLADVLGAVIAKDTNKPLPPININPHLVLGCVTANMQAVCMIKDIISHTSHTEATNDAVNALYTNSETRKKFYAMYRSHFCTKAFDVMKYIDPLNIGSINGIGDTMPDNHLDSYWSLTKFDLCMINSTSSYLYSGIWHAVPTMRDLGKEERRRATGTYKQLGIVAEEDNLRPVPARVNVRDVLNSRTYNRLNRTLQPGKIRVMPGEVLPYHKTFDPVSFSNFERIPRPVEGEKEADVKLEYDTAHYWEDDVIIVDDDDSSDDTVPEYDLHGNVTYTSSKTASIEELKRRAANAARQADINKKALAKENEDNVSRVLSGLSNIKFRKRGYSSDNTIKISPPVTKPTNSLTSMVLPGSNSSDERDVYMLDDAIRQIIRPKLASVVGSMSRSPCKVWNNIMSLYSWCPSQNYMWCKCLKEISESGELYGKMLDLCLDRNDFGECIENFREVVRVFGNYPETIEISTLGCDNNESTINDRRDILLKMCGMMRTTLKIQGKRIKHDTQIHPILNTDISVSTMGNLRMMAGYYKEKGIISDKEYKIIANINLWVPTN